MTSARARGKEFVEEFHAALVPVKRKLYKRIITVCGILLK
jgi:hypothetical protein